MRVLSLAVLALLTACSSNPKSGVEGAALTPLSYLPLVKG
jgi:hypothetical protein